MIVLEFLFIIVLIKYCTFFSHTQNYFNLFLLIYVANYFMPLRGVI